MRRKKRFEPGLKKRRVQESDAPSNRTFGNCLLGCHSIPKDLAGTRASTSFPAVAGIRQEQFIHKLSTASQGYPKTLLEPLFWTAINANQPASGAILDAAAGNAVRGRREVNGR